MQKISYVIPCYRSQHTVGGVVAEIAATMQTLPQYDYEVILVNDCSPDDTFGTIRSLVAADSHVVGVDLAKNFGQHAALMAGFHKCSGDIVVCLDDDGQTPADEVGKLLAKIDEGYDVVYASYDTKRQAGWRNLGSWVNSKMTEIMLGKPPELVVNSYFAARRFIVDEMLRYEHCYPYVIGLVLDERLYVVFCQAAAHCDLHRHAVCRGGLSLLYLYHHRPLYPRGGPHRVGVHHGAAAAARRHDPGRTGHYGRVRGPHLHVRQRRAPVRRARGHPA